MSKWLHCANIYTWENIHVYSNLADFWIQKPRGCHLSHYDVITDQNFAVKGCPFQHRPRPARDVKRVSISLSFWKKGTFLWWLCRCFGFWFWKIVSEVQHDWFWSACVYNRSELFPGFTFSLAPRLTVDACAVNAYWRYWSSNCRANNQHCRKRRQGFVQGKLTVCHGMDRVLLLRSVIWVSLFAPGLWSAIWVSFFHSRSVVRVTFQSLGMSVFWVKNESVWSVMTTCNGI